MKTLILILLVFPALLWGHDYVFHQEFDSVQVQISDYTLPAAWTGGYEKSKPELCDLDGDGDRDFIVGFSDHYLHYYSNVGSLLIPSFHLTSTQFTGFSFGAYYGITCPAAGDLDADGDLDLLVGTGDGVIVRLENIGTSANYQFQVTSDTLRDISGNWIWSGWIDLVDIDHDGDLDLILGRNNGFLKYYQNVGTPYEFQLQLADSQFAGVSMGDQSDPDPCFCDLDADGDYDLFIGDYYGRIWYYRNDGTPQAPNFTFVTNNWEGIDVGDFASPDFADMDGDGDFDLWVGMDAYSQYNSNEPGDVFYYENIGTAQSPQFQLIRANNLTLDAGNTCGPQLTSDNYNNRINLWYTNVLYLSFYENIGTTQTPEYSLISNNMLNGVMAQFTYMVDWDADGDLDLVSANGAWFNGVITFYRNIGSSQNPSFISADTMQTPYTLGSPSLVDIDADGDYDMFIPALGHGIVYYQNQGTPQHPNFVFQMEQWQSSLGSDFPNFADMDNDGDYDIIIFRTDFVTFIPEYWENIGTPQNGQWVLADSSLFECPLNVGRLTAGNLDGDGDMDIITGSIDGGCYFFRNVTGDTTGVKPRPIPPTPTEPILSLFPNPANAGAVVRFMLPGPGLVRVGLFDVEGRNVGAHCVRPFGGGGCSQGARSAPLQESWFPAGSHDLRLDMKDLPSGVYLIRLDAGQQRITQKMVVVK